jgi:Fic family protein
MLKTLNLPQNREHGSYIIRRSMATILRNWHHEAGRTQVSEWDLQAQMGHRGTTTTEAYAKAGKTHKSTVQRALEEVLEELENLAPGALHRRNTGAATPSHGLRLVASQEKPRVSAGL